MTYNPRTGLLTCDGSDWGRRCGASRQVPEVMQYEWSEEEEAVPTGLELPSVHQLPSVLAKGDPLLAWDFDPYGGVYVPGGSGGAATCPGHRVLWSDGADTGRPRTYGGGSVNALAEMRAELFDTLRDQVVAAYERLGLPLPLLGVRR